MRMALNIYPGGVDNFTFRAIDTPKVGKFSICICANGTSNGLNTISPVVGFRFEDTLPDFGGVIPQGNAFGLFYTTLGQINGGQACINWTSPEITLPTDRVIVVYAMALFGSGANYTFDITKMEVKFFTCNENALSYSPECGFPSMVHSFEHKMDAECWQQMLANQKRKIRLLDKDVGIEGWIQSLVYDEKEGVVQGEIIGLDFVPSPRDEDRELLTPPEVPIFGIKSDSGVWRSASGLWWTK